MQKLIVIIGPTGTKKTTLAHLIAQNLNGEIINGDVYQLYRDINAGINKPSLKKQNEIKYHLIDKLDIFDKYSIFDYQKDVDIVYSEILKNKKIPILCGGSHLYLDAVIRGYSLSEDSQKYINEIEQWSNDQIVEYLKTYDPISLEKTFNNHHRMVRAVAYLMTHDNKPKYETEILNNNPKYKCLIIMTDNERHNIYNLVNDRILEFINKNNWINEVKQLVNKYGNEIINSQAFKAIGYKEIYDYVLNKGNLNISKIQAKTRHLVKHQTTWCLNKFPNKIRFNVETDDLESLLTKIRDFWYD